MQISRMHHRSQRVTEIAQDKPLISF